MFLGVEEIEARDGGEVVEVVVGAGGITCHNPLRGEGVGEVLAPGFQVFVGVEGEDGELAARRETGEDLGGGEEGGDTRAVVAVGVVEVDEGVGGGDGTEGAMFALAGEVGEVVGEGALAVLADVGELETVVAGEGLVEVAVAEGVFEEGKVGLLVAVGGVGVGEVFVRQ